MILQKLILLLGMEILKHVEAVMLAGMILGALLAEFVYLYFIQL